MAHREYENMLTLEALNALDASEKRALDEHLTTCSACRGELTELRDAAALLVHTVPQAEPRPEVRARILDEARKESTVERAQTSSVLQFKTREAASTWTNLLRLAAVIAFGALLIGVVIFWQRDVRSRREIARLSRELRQQQEDLTRNRETLARQRAALEMLNAPGMKRIELAGTETAKTARATLVYDRDTGRAMLLTNGLPLTPSGMAYEVWFIPKGKSPMPGKTFTVDADGHAMMADQIPPEARDNAIIAVTMEPKSGSSSPTGAMYLSSPAL